MTFYQFLHVLSCPAPFVSAISVKLQQNLKIPVRKLHGGLGVFVLLSEMTSTSSNVIFFPSSLHSSVHQHPEEESLRREDRPVSLC